MVDLKETVRLDRWLVAVRVFKTRALAAKAIAGGKIKVNGESAKAHKLVRLEDDIRLKRNGQEHAYRVKKIQEKRVSAAEAAICFEHEIDPGMDEETKAMLQTVRQLAIKQITTKGRPTKKDRRVLDRFKESLS